MARFPLGPATAVTALLLISCNGYIDEPPAGVTPRLDPGDPHFCDMVDLEPGQPTLRRLNRREYNNTVRDLLGVETRPADAFPEDDVSGEGFTNNGEVLTLSPLLLEKYDEAARALAAAAIASGSVARERYITCDPAVTGADACAREVVRELGLRAFRRPLDPAELDRLVAIVRVGTAEGEPFDAALALAIRAILLSPNFLYRVELHDARIRPLDGWELASRLSYFLWASTPDEELLALASTGDLAGEAVLREQVERMLSDERAAGFYEAFAGEWLSLPNLAYSDPDPALYEFDDELRAAMRTETLLFVQEVVDRGLPLSTLLSANFTFLNERLAQHYGVSGVTGPEFRRVTLTGAQRGGILSQGSILTVTSHPDRTSPVKRGKWILDQLLCEPPPDPPPDVDTFIGGRPEGETLRERLERHRERAECAVCHDSIDPLGLGLENYDAVGQWRTEDNGDAVDPSGVLPDGRTFVDAHGLTSILSVDERTTSCITEKLLAYSLGRGLSASDRCYVEELLGGTAGPAISVRDLIVRIVTNDVFRRIGGREDEP